jgi:homoserine O-acetyltransferase
MLSIAGSAPAQMQKSLPTQAAIDKYRQDLVANEFATVDADDLIYQLNASKDYDPSANLERITAKVLWINSADDFINPPELGIAERLAPRIKHGRFILLPISENTHGHGTHTWAVAWKAYLKELLDSPQP